jgi:hypothetical protein
MPGCRDLVLEFEHELKQTEMYRERFIDAEYIALRVITFEVTTPSGRVRTLKKYMGGEGEGLVIRIIGEDSPLSISLLCYEPEKPVVYVKIETPHNEENYTLSEQEFPRAKQWLVDMLNRIYSIERVRKKLRSPAHRFGGRGGG